MKNIILVFAFLFFTYQCYSQEIIIGDSASEAKNTAYFAFGGPGIYFSLIYERHLIIDDSYYFGLKGGIGTSFSSVLFPNEFNFPVGAYFLYGKRLHYLDVSLNFSNQILHQYNYTDNDSFSRLKLLVVPSVCYRYQKQNGGFIGRFGISPIINFDHANNTFTPWIDMGIGWSF